MDNLHEPVTECLKEFGEELKKTNFSKFKEILGKKKVEWEMTKVKIGVAGPSGAGKSTFVNEYRGKKPRSKDEDLAYVGEAHTTKKVTGYPDPRNSKIELHDLPGLGAPDFGKEKYIEKVGLEDYDFIILITSERFREDDIWLYNQICQLQKPVFLVRNKTMIGVQEKMDREKINKRKALETYKKECIQELQAHIDAKNNATDENHTIYFLDCHHKMDRKLDFSKLIIESAIALPTPKHDKVILSDLGVITAEILKEKYKTLKRWLPFTAALCSVEALVQVPDTPHKVHFSIIKLAVKYYSKQFGIEKTTYEEFIPDRKERAAKWVTEIITSWAELVLKSSKLSSAVKKGAEAAARIAEIAAGASCAAGGAGAACAVGAAVTEHLITFLKLAGKEIGITYYTLQILLDEMYEDAKEIYVKPYQK